MSYLSSRRVRRQALTKNAFWVRSSAHPVRSVIALCLLLVPLTLARAYASRTGPIDSQEQTPALEPGIPIQRDLAGGEAHSYGVALAADRFLRIVVDQRGIDIDLKLLGPDGRVLIDMDTPNSTQGPEVAALVSEQPGLYRVEVSSSTKGIPAGRYEVRIDALRPVTDSDRTWMAGQTAYLEGHRLRRQGAAESRRKSIETYQSAIPHWQAARDTVMEAHTLLSLAASWRGMGQPQQALECYLRARELQQSGEGKRESAYTLSLLGAVHNDLGDPHKALECLQQAIELQRSMKDLYAEAVTTGYLGNAWFFLGEASKAMENYARALTAWKRMNNPGREAETLHNIGRSHEVTGEYQKALEYYLQALATYQALKNRDGEADELNAVGFVNGLLGEWSKALEYYSQALALRRAAGDRRNEAITLGNIGIAHAKLNDPRKALEFYTRAIELHRQVRNRRTEALTLQYLGDLHVSSSDTAKALESYQQALELRRATGDRAGEAGTLYSIGLLHVSLGGPRKAMEFFNQSLALFQAIGEPRGKAAALYGIARAERDRGNLAEARQRVEAALSLIESLRADVDSQQLRASYLASVRKYYELNIDLLMRLHRTHPAEGFDALAVQASERARARGLLELLTEAGAKLREGADPALLERERALSEKLNAKARSRMELQSRPRKPEQEEELKREITRLETEYEQAQAAIRQNSPHYAAVTQPQPLGLNEIQQQLDGETLLLEYSLGEERSFLWAITRDSIASHELPNREQVETLAKQVYELLTARSRIRRGETIVLRRERIAREEAQLPEAARQLSQMLLAPLAASLGRKRLVVVADGALQYLPFAMLPVPESESERQGDKGTRGQGNPQSATPLIVNHEIITLPSASTLAVQRRELADRKPAPKLLAVIADPVFAANDERNKTSKARLPNALSAARSVEHEEESAAVTVGRFSIPRLPFTRQEADRILALAPGSSNLKALDFRASRATAIDSELGQYRYLHFATHGLLDSERPGLSSLVLSLVDEQGKPQDGFLRAHEIYNLHLPADLVVLSACQTGLGKDVRGEGLVGLTRGFMYAGAARVVVSLWSVNDRATSELMARFYQKMLKDGQRPAAALRAAQVELWRQKQWQAPFYWASFVLQGEWK